MCAGKENRVEERNVANAVWSKTEKILERYGCRNERIVWCRLKGKYANVTMVEKCLSA